MLGINSAPTEHAAQYLNIWLGRIKEKPDLFFKASAMAQKAVNYIENLQKNINKAA
jgi:antirestriction protein ArdC